jgi:hypothetical protein
MPRKNGEKKQAAVIKSEKATRTLKDMFSYINQNILAMNQSKIFAGLVIIVLNISSKFVTIKLSKPMEGYLKYTFSRDILVFAMAWMGTRDIYTALFITLLFTLCANFLFNEQSRFCCLPESFITQHTEAMDTMQPSDITPQQIADATKLLASAQKMREAENPKEEGAPAALPFAN